MKQSLSSKNSSTGSIKSKSSWSMGNNCGESMALKDSTSVSLNSSVEDHRNKNNNNNTQSYCTRKKDIDCDEDELSSMTITAEHSSSSPSKDEKEIVNDAFLKQSQQQQPRMGSISRKELFIQVDEVKFAETIAATQNTALLDDETSPSDSLVSSSESGDVPMKKVKESKMTINDIKEEDLEDITPELDDLPSPGTPTHASNSLSLSDDVGRDDFLLDDEIADQPALMMSQTKQQKGSLSHHDDYMSGAMNLSSTDGTTPTLRDISVNSHGSLRSLNRIHMHALKTINSGQSSPAMNRKVIMERSGSLDTLSPCDSIASDDLMGDFDINSSLDSIDR